jgi:hypothetical protein
MPIGEGRWWLACAATLSSLACGGRVDFDPHDASPAVTVPPPDAGSEEGGCDSAMGAYEEPQGPSDSCGACVKKGCASEFARCAADCDCQDSLSNALTCAKTGSALQGCLMSETMSNMSQTLSDLSECVTEANLDCACLSRPINAPAPDASGCFPGSANLGGGGNGANGGGCTSNFVEICAGTVYQVYCSCPRAQCACLGPSTQFVDFPGCPFCPAMAAMGPGAPGAPVTPTGSITANQVFALCGFPDAGWP